MTVNGSQAIQLLQESYESSELKETPAIQHTVKAAATKITPVPESPENSQSLNPYYHTAFMQCRSCCNCDPQCSYYGKGHFDSKGNYIGP